MIKTNWIADVHHELTSGGGPLTEDEADICVTAIRQNCPFKEDVAYEPLVKGVASEAIAHHIATKIIAAHKMRSLDQPWTVESTTQLAIAELDKWHGYKIL